MLKTAIAAVTVLATFATAAMAANNETMGKATDPPTCEKPISTVIVANIPCKAAQCQPSSPTTTFIMSIAALAGQPQIEGIGTGISDMFLSAIKQTKCFTVLERENMEELRQELAMKGIALPSKTADLLVAGAVTSLAIESTSANAGLGILPVLSLIDIKKTKASISMDIRLVDVNSTEIILTKTYHSESQKTSTGIGAGGAASGIGFGAAYSALRGTSLEEAARHVVLTAVGDIVSAAELLQGQHHASKSVTDSEPGSITNTNR